MRSSRVMRGVEITGNWRSQNSRVIPNLEKDDENEICLVGMKSAGNELVPTIGSSVELGIASQVVNYFTDPNAIEPPDMQILFPFVESALPLVVDEVLTRRKETEWFIEGDFDAYVERIRKPYVWGGELELLMASHLLK
ncbi:OTU domain-containing protein [Camellia lanceoleosa]|uniref:OTU domain-containing protein n=1 Tax=Camellia lanceoleosa TaxID=1840588 RepID=A0ACC0FVF4_9ERIC|nr:OTU domain-containing protein [Camellia lanceoleosa]